MKVLVVKERLGNHHLEAIRKKKRFFYAPPAHLPKTDDGYSRTSKVLHKPRTIESRIPRREFPGTLSI